MKLTSKEQNLIKGCGKVVYITGVMCSGKTTIVHELNKWNHFSIIPEFLEDMPFEVLSTRKDSQYKEKLYSQMWILDQYIKKNLLVKETKGLAIVDRTWIDALTYSYLYGGEIFNEIQKAIDEQEWLPGIYINLFANEEAIRERAKRKFCIDESLYERDWKNYVDELIKINEEIVTQYNIFNIDTSHQNIEDTVQIINEYLGTKIICQSIY